MKHVIVVEDDPHNAMLFRKVLEKRVGCTVTVTESPAELVTLARAGGVHLVIMDVSLANSTWEGKQVGGVELCHLLKNDPRTCGIPVLLATAHAMRGDAESLIAESGADGYVSKPILDHTAFVAQATNLMKEAA